MRFAAVRILFIIFDKVMDDITTTSTEFPTLQDFKNEVAEERLKALSFKTLPLNTVYEISGFKNVVVDSRDAIIAR